MEQTGIEAPVASTDDSSNTLEEVAVQNEPDYFLQALVALANDGVEIGITLTLKGFLIAGIITSGKHFFADMREKLPTNLAEGMRESMAKFFDSFGSIYDPPAEGDERPHTVFIHLREARYFHNAGVPIPTNGALMWRGRLADVQGFSLGEMRPN